jgi:hypothetical protein
MDKGDKESTKAQERRKDVKHITRNKIYKYVKKWKWMMNFKEFERKR